MDKDLNTSDFISVIMPVYNTANYVKQAIESILTQTYTNFELLIYNDGSTDGTADVIRSITDGRIIFHDSKENKGNVYWVNKAIKSAKGSLIARMDSDDIALPTRFEKQIAVLNTHPEVGVCGTWLQPFNDKAKSSAWTYPETNPQIKADFLFANPIGQPSVMIRSAIFEKYALQYDTDFFPCEDYYLWYKLHTLTDFYNIPEVLVDYRIHSGQSTRVKKGAQSLTDKINRLFWLQSGLITADGLEKVETFIQNKWQQTEAFLRASGEYLMSLISKNEQLKRIDITFFERRVYDLFWRQCYFASSKNCNGLKIYNEFVTDSNYKLTMKNSMKTYLKQVFK